MKRNNLRDTILKARQGAVSKAGSDWECYVENFLKGGLDAINKKRVDLSMIIQDIFIQRMGKKSEIENIRQAYPKLYETLFIPIINFAKDRDFLLKNPEVIDAIFETGIMGDTDIVVFSHKYQVPIAIVSCKVSLQGRLTETLFYSLYYRITNKIKFVLATPDKGKQVTTENWESEWGSIKNPSKDRVMSTLFCDGVYVDNVPQFMPPGFKPEKNKTILGGIVRDLSELPTDIIRWYEDIKFSTRSNNS